MILTRHLQTGLKAFLKENQCLPRLSAFKDVFTDIQIVQSYSLIVFTAEFQLIFQRIPEVFESLAPVGLIFTFIVYASYII